MTLIMLIFAGLIGDFFPRRSAESALSACYPHLPGNKGTLMTLIMLIFADLVDGFYPRAIL